MEFKRLSYTDGTGKVSKAIESYNFHKAAGVLAEYGFDCIGWPTTGRAPISWRTTKPRAGRSKSSSRPAWSSTKNTCPTKTCICASRWTERAPGI